MTGDALWWLVMVLAVVCTVLAAMLLRKPRVGPPGPGAGKPDAAAVLARQGAAKSVAVSAGTASVANVLAPQPAAGAPQGIDQRRGGARLAERDGVQPEPARTRRVAVVAQAFADRFAVQGLGTAAPPQAQQVQRLRQHEQRRIQRTGGAHAPRQGHEAATSTLLQASQVAWTVGIGRPSSATWCRWPWLGCGPVRQAVAWL